MQFHTILHKRKIKTMKTFETKVLRGPWDHEIEDLGKNGWQPVLSERVANTDGSYYTNVTFQRETDAYFPPLGIKRAVDLILVAKARLRTEHGIRKQGETGRVLKEALTELENILDEVK